MTNVVFGMAIACHSEDEERGISGLISGLKIEKRQVKVHGRL